MNRPLTDRERCLQLEARVAELEEELSAYKALEDQEARWAREAGRLHRVSKELRRLAGPKNHLARSRGHGMARVLLDLLAHVGMCRSPVQIYNAYNPAAADVPDSLKVVGVMIHYTRQVVGHAAIETVWGQGYLVPFEQAAALRARIGEGGP